MTTSALPSVRARERDQVNAATPRAISGGYQIKHNVDDWDMAMRQLGFLPLATKGGPVKPAGSSVSQFGQPVK